MQPIFLLDLVSRHANWASFRQATITGNIANANTPGYKAKDVEPFTSVLDKTHLEMAKTADSHLDIRSNGVRDSRLNGDETWGVTYSGNSVTLDQEMLKAGEVNRVYTLDMNIMRSFHRLMMTGLRTQG
ncbi:MAG: flagellar basal body rod protein FlgB [Pseudomonadota bacterium]